MAGEVRAFQRVVGTTAEDSSRFVAAFDDMGISASSAGVALGRFTRLLGTDTKALDDRGIAVAKTAKGTTDVKETFLNLAEAVSRSSDVTAKNALVIEAFGRSGLELLPILAKGRAGIDELFAGAERSRLLFSQEDLDTAEELRVATDELDDAVSGLQVTAGKRLAPFAADFARGLSIILAGGVESAVAASSAARATKSLVDQNAALKETEEKAKAASDALKEHAAVIDAMRGAVLDATSAQRALTAANRSVTDASDGVAAAQEKLNELLAKGAVDQEKVTSARAKLAGATEALEEAERSLADNRQVEHDAQDAQISAIDKRADAEERLADLISGRVAAETLAEHSHDLEHATLAVRSAVLAQRGAQQRLADTQGDATATADDLAGAQLDLEEANLRVAEAQENVTATQAELTRIQNIGTAGSAELVAAQDALTAADGAVDAATRTLMDTYGARTELERGVTDAVAAQVATQQALSVVLAGDAAFAGQVADARRVVRDAEEGLTGARLAASQAAFSLAEKQEGLNDQFGGKSLEDIRETRAELEKIVKLQPGSAAFLAPALSLLLAQLFRAAVPITDFGNVLAGVTLPAAPATPDYRAWLASQQGKPFALGGFSGAGGPAWLHPREVVLPLDNPSRTGQLLGQAGLAGNTFVMNLNVEAHLGPGSNATDLERLMRRVAQDANREFAQQILAKANAGVGRA